MVWEVCLAAAARPFSSTAQRLIKPLLDNKNPLR
jgi:hypothetical protein